MRQAVGDGVPVALVGDEDMALAPEAGRHVERARRDGGPVAPSACQKRLAPQVPQNPRRAASEEWNQRSVSSRLRTRSAVATFVEAM